MRERKHECLCLLIRTVKHIRFVLVAVSYISVPVHWKSTSTKHTFNYMKPLFLWVAEWIKKDVKFCREKKNNGSLRSQLLMDLAVMEYEFIFTRWWKYRLDTGWGHYCYHVVNISQIKRGYPMVRIGLKMPQPGILFHDLTGRLFFSNKK